jgi:hypothetical protein
VLTYQEVQSVCFRDLPVLLAAGNGRNIAATSWLHDCS